MKYKILYIYNICALIFFFSCGNSDVTAYYNDIEESKSFHHSYSRQDSIEAKKLALWFTGNITPPEEIVSEFLYNLNYLRYLYKDSFEFLNTKKGGRRFLPPWRVGELTIAFNDTTAKKVNKNEYEGWQTLRANLRPDTILSYPDFQNICTVGFSNLLHPERLAKIYSDLPGVVVCEANTIEFAGFANYPILPGLVNKNFTYLFYNYNMDDRIYYYFKYIDNEPEYVGKWNQDSDHPKPDWFDEAGRIGPVSFSDWEGF